MQSTPTVRRGNAAFTTIVGAAMFAGAGVMALVLGFSGAPVAVAIGLVLAAIPVIPLIGAYLWLDRYEPEPRNLLVLGLGWGAFVATALSLALQIIDTFAFRTEPTAATVVVAPLTEEASKGLFILLLLWFRRAELDGVLDGIVYAGMVGIGFAFTENILYLTAAYMGEDEGVGGIEGAVTLFIVRCVFGPFAHPLFTAFIGVGIGIAVGARSRAVRVAAPLIGYLLAVASHALWNGSLAIDQGAHALTSYFFLILPGFLLFVGFAIWARRREGRVLAMSLDDCAQRGFLHPAEVPYLSSIPGRRALRRNATAVGGHEAGRAMRDYQVAVVELGFLHHRFLRGTPPDDYAALGDAHLKQMLALRPHLIWPEGGRSR